MSMADDFTLGSDFPVVSGDNSSHSSFAESNFEQTNPPISSPLESEMAPKQVSKGKQAAKSKTNSGPDRANASQPSGQPSQYHRIAEVRRLQGISVRSASRRMGIPMEQVRREERPDANLTMEQMIRWQKALEVPIVDLMIDDNSPLSMPVLARAKWLRLMKTVKALLESSESSSTTCMAQMLEQQVLEVMPELRDVSGWHSVGQRRTQDELGRIAESPVSSNFARDGLS